MPPLVILCVLSFWAKFPGNFDIDGNIPIRPYLLPHNFHISVWHLYLSLPTGGQVGRGPEAEDRVWLRSYLGTLTGGQVGRTPEAEARVWLHSYLRTPTGGQVARVWL